MIVREAVTTLALPCELTLTSPPNWIAVIFFAALSGIHLALAIPAFDHGPLEGNLSLAFAAIFALVAVAAFLLRQEMTLLPRQGRICVRSGIGRLGFRRAIDFADVHAVRLTLPRSGRPRDARIEVLSNRRDIECPPTSIPRQQALYLAILMNVHLIKISFEDLPDHSAHGDRVI